MTAHLPNYLRMHRKRSGLLQDEVATLVGVASGVRVSRHELHRRVPSLKVALAYSRLYGLPVEELFAGLAEEVDSLFTNQAQDLLARDLDEEQKDRLRAFLGAELPTYATRPHPERASGSTRHPNTRH